VRIGLHIVNFDALSGSGTPIKRERKGRTTYILLAPNRQSAAEVVDLCSNLAQTGIQYTIFIMPSGYAIEPLNIVGEVNCYSRT
jgi:hypothetical protein